MEGRAAKRQVKASNKARILILVSGHVGQKCDSFVQRRIIYLPKDVIKQRLLMLAVATRPSLRSIGQR